MADFNVRSDNVDVEQIMHQIRARIREKRGVDYTEQQIRELATVKLERFLDPDGIRSDLLDQFHRARATSEPLPSFEFEDTTLYKSHRLPILETIRKLLNPILKLFFNPNPLIQALHIQSELNEVYSNRQHALFRADSQPGRRDDAAEHRGEEPQDAGRVALEPPRFQRAAGARARGCRSIQAHTTESTEGSARSAGRR